MILHERGKALFVHGECCLIVTANKRLQNRNNVLENIYITFSKNTTAPQIGTIIESMITAIRSKNNFERWPGRGRKKPAPTKDAKQVLKQPNLEQEVSMYEFSHETTTYRPHGKSVINRNCNRC